MLGWSGALPVTGSGIRITVSGAIPGDAIELLLNELRNAGAEAAAIGGVRIVPGVVATGPAGDGRRARRAARRTPWSSPPSASRRSSRARWGAPAARSPSSAARFPDVIIGVVAVDLVTVPATDRDLTPQLARPRL